ncbi:MAG: hypothetical protein KGJ60_04440, partial [Verrucomicrobiota bacterium]|nr:hypothetical protein [Verrucomicrobiota bacterium]
KDLNGLAPSRLLRGVDFAQVKHVPLHHPASAIDAPVFDQAPVVVLLAIFDTTKNGSNIRRRCRCHCLAIAGTRIGSSARNFAGCPAG